MGSNLADACFCRISFPSQTPLDLMSPVLPQPLDSAQHDSHPYIHAYTHPSTHTYIPTLTLTYINKPEHTSSLHPNLFNKATKDNDIQVGHDILTSAII